MLNFPFSPGFFFPNYEVGNDIGKAHNNNHQNTGGKVVEVTDNQARDDPEGEIGDCEWEGQHDCHGDISESLVVMMYCLN